ncbi:TlpA family protein disulfide reductase [Streptomyces hirsutus]|uniref:TlpA family protein disulfide reductase n=1 Tax=Streptomyces hirsutus TaxID=35620 RepID=A0ABZ1GSH8_9ACTN|nr:TlpA disulfide reductase family protein [Streptomyces hirsutus]WSD08196.1 TlpA family protein disulfide reductase [Streptomyces hirsutus]WTD18353.1 TlpA family protein disulfide reductase [Streptomyces hirsutus]WTD76721.1 TlpA family protein disulfide reductase [Streptomyces sp. NBC_01635]
MSAVSRAPQRSNRATGVCDTGARAARVRPPRARASRRAALTAGAAVAALLLTACGSGGTSGGGGNTNFVTGTDGISTAAKGERAAAPELSGKTLEGEHLDVADFQGKVVVLNMWGSWCNPCRAEAKYFAKVSKDYADQDVQFVGINTRDSTTGAALAFEKDFGVTYPSLYDPTGKLMLRFEKGTLNPQAIPSTLILDRDGGIAARSLTALSEERLLKMLEPVLAEK